MKAIIYIRKSKESKYSPNSISLDMQEDRCRDYARSRDIEVVRVICDDGVSGFKTMQRKGFVELLTEVKQGGIDAVIVYNLSRFSRNTEATLTTIREFDRQGVRLMSVTDSLDTGTAVGKLFLTMTAAFNQYERDITGERVKDALRRKKDKGEALGSVPYGYKRQGKSLVEDPTEQFNIEIVLELHEQGKSLRTIAAIMEARAIPGRTGIKWHHDTINRIVKFAEKKVA